jgi:hypothetical protein
VIVSDAGAAAHGAEPFELVVQVAADAGKGEVIISPLARPLEIRLEPENPSITTEHPAPRELPIVSELAAADDSVHVVTASGDGGAIQEQLLGLPPRFTPR